MSGRARRVAAWVATGAVLAACAVVATRLWRTSVPGDLQLPRLDVTREISAHDLERAESFAALLRWSSLASQVVLVAVLAVYARHGARWMRESAAGPIGTGFLLGMLGLGLAWLAGLPFGLLEFWWSRRHDTVEVGWASYLFGDWLSLAGQFVFVCLALLVAMGFARRLRRTWWLPAAAVFAGLALLFTFVTPWLTSLREPPTALRADAARLAQRAGVGNIPLKVEEVREQTSQPNAYAFGLGASRRVVLWDTILDFPRREVRVVIAHEYAHQAHAHIAKSVGWAALLLVPTTLLVAALTRRRGGLGRPEAVPLALLVVVLVGLAATPLQSTVSRRYEAEADWAALRSTRDAVAMRQLFRHFTRDGLGDPDPPGWYQALFGDHPSALQRIAMARAWAARQR